jgi:PIN domain nuclease of toxin-antitoxin system
MNLLLDTHVLLWWLDDPALLSREAREAITEGRSIVFVSVAAVWEIDIKKARGKLSAPDDLEAVMADARFTPLAISLNHVLAVSSLPSIHEDPFDRIQAAQAQMEGLRLVTRDARLLTYPVNVLKA